MFTRLAILVTILGNLPTALADDTSYVSIGASAGVDKAIDWMYTGAAVAGAYRLGTTWWLRGGLGAVARAGYGTTHDLTLISPRTEAYAATIGLEGRRCRDELGLCILAGIDAGYRVVETGHLGPWVVNLRFALEVGWEHVRFRPGIEAVLGGTNDGEDFGPPEVGIGLAFATAYRW